MPRDSQPDDLSQLELWLRGTTASAAKLWVVDLSTRGVAAPLAVPASTMPVSFVARRLRKQGSPWLQEAIGAATSDLISDWTPDKGSQLLDDLLVIVSVLATYSANDALYPVVAYKLKGAPNELHLRQRALAAIASIGPSARTASLAADLLADPRMTASALAVLARTGPEEFARALPRVAAVADASERSRDIVTAVSFALQHSIPRESLSITLAIALSEAPPPLRSRVAHLLARSGVSIRPASHLDYDPASPQLVHAVDDDTFGPVLGSELDFVSMSELVSPSLAASQIDREIEEVCGR